MRVLFCAAFLIVALVYEICQADHINEDVYKCDISGGLGRRFDGIGAISGGGATSKLLVNYPEPQRSEILDFLFKPNFGASVHIFKVEIGGDVQSTEGTESSHMHYAWDLNYKRGYEWWMMAEAKKRNPDVKLYGLPWGFPGWVSSSQMWPYENPDTLATYTTNWVIGAKQVYNLTIDYLGIWNEKPYNISYVKALRTHLDKAGLSNVKLVVGDDIKPLAWKVFDDMAQDQKFRDVVDFVGIHYPKTQTPERAKNSGKPLWSSEDHASQTSESGGAGLAQLLNQNYVNGLMTSSIIWNIIASYYNDLPDQLSSLMLANEPWSGYYEVTAGIWVFAHTTQFTKAGWQYLPHGSGVEMLHGGGSMVSLISPDRRDFTIIIENMENNGRVQNVSIVLQGDLAKIKTLNLWYTKLAVLGAKGVHFQNSTVKVDNGVIRLMINTFSLFTLTTVQTGHKGSHKPSPPSKPFPLPYQDTFDSYADGSEAYNFAQQVGAFEVTATSDAKHRKVLSQVVLQRPVHWCPQIQSQPVTFVGNYNWSDIKLTVDMMVPSTNGSDGGLVGLRVTTGGCYTFTAQGVYMFLLVNKQKVIIAADLTRTKVLHSASFQLSHDTWYHVEFSISKNLLSATIDGSSVFNDTVQISSQKGFVAIGTDNFGLGYFDNVQISSP